MEFLKEYVNTPSPSGYEMVLGGQKVWINYVTPFCDRVETDDYGNAYAYYNKKKEGFKTVLIDAHGDEIGFFVFDITKDGFLKIGRLGGSDITIAPSSRVDVWGENGKVNGVFGHPAIHIQEKELKLKVEDMFIDLGVSSSEEVEALGITVGTPITMSDGYMELGNYFCGRSLDDKIGGYINSQVLKSLYENKVELPFELVILNAVQEEVGLHGAQMASEKIRPDVAIVIDVTHDTDSPCYSKSKQGSVSFGKGVVFGNAPSIHKNLFKLLVNTAKENELPYQIHASGRGSGTNADSYAYPCGIPTCLLSLGMRYMHTTCEMVNKDDVKSAIALLLKVLDRKELIESFKYI